MLYKVDVTSSKDGEKQENHSVDGGNAGGERTRSGEFGEEACGDTGERGIDFEFEFGRNEASQAFKCCTKAGFGCDAERVADRRERASESDIPV